MFGAVRMVIKVFKFISCQNQDSQCDHSKINENTFYYFFTKSNSKFKQKLHYTSYHGSGTNIITTDLLTNNNEYQTPLLEPIFHSTNRTPQVPICQL